MSLSSDFLHRLIAEVQPHISLPNVNGGNDIYHVRRVIKIGLEEITYLEFDKIEFTALAYLHELDRSKSFETKLEADYSSLFQFTSAAEKKARYKEQKKKALKIAVNALLMNNSGFQPDVIRRIVTAVLDHSKFANDPSDSSLLTAFRDADKLDRMGALGLVTAAIHRGSTDPIFDSDHPFGYGCTAEDMKGRMRSVYEDWFRVFEWYVMLSCDASRKLAEKPWRLPARIQMMRVLAEEICQIAGATNQVEKDFEKAFGKYYDHLCHM